MSFSYTTAMQPIKKVLFRNKKKYFWREGDLHTDAGVVKEADLLADNWVVKAHSGKELQVMPASFNDNIDKAKRGPQSLLRKDIGLILIETALDNTKTVLEAGTGSGLLTAYLSRYAKKVISYEINEAHQKLAKKNLDFLESKNVELKLGNVEEKIDEENIDIIILDLPCPDKVIPQAQKALKQGGYIVVYVPSTTQVSWFVEKARDHFHIEKVTELLEREWFVEGKKVRPKSQMQGHTAFMVFARKL